MQMSIDDYWTFYQVNLPIHTFSKHINLASPSTGKNFSVSFLRSASCSTQMQEQVYRRFLVPLWKEKKGKRKKP